MINALSIDLEEWCHSELVEGRRSSFSKAEEATRPILDLLDRYQTRASFFIVGEVAEQSPRLIQSIFDRGHEIGCHTFSHKFVWNLGKSLFQDGLGRFHSVMEKILGKIGIKGFRVPCFSIYNRNRWALKVLSDFGYRYDASIFPLKINPPQSFLVYFHLWESYEKTPRFKLPLYNRVISYYGISSALEKLEFLLKHFKFTRVDHLLGLG